MKRRDFLKAGTLAATAAALISPKTGLHAAEDSAASVKKYTEIGKTGLKMSDISCGCGGAFPSGSLMLRAIDRGINYFDTAPDYGRSESYIGEAMKSIKRDKVIIASKFCNPMPYPGHLSAGASKDQYIASVDGSLSRMKTPYIDFVFVHAIGEADKDKDKELKRLLDENMLSAFEALKKAGKVKFLAVSSHGPSNMEDLLMAAVNSGHYAMIMPSFNFMKFPKVPDVLKEAKKKGVGVVAMKTLAGAKDMRLDFKGADFAQSAFKWTLKHPEVNGLVVTMKSVGDLDNYLPASGKEYTALDERILDKYARTYGSSYCRTGCGLCEGMCANGVEIAAALRYQMYFIDYGMEKHAMESYASLTNKAEACLTCKLATCAGACPYGLPVAALLRETHKTLTFNV
ncbi:MAG: aldo/keto reductase [Nitrospirae bacterium]|nr:aldo/keto reductase [Nitrospirota bacterium]